MQALKKTKTKQNIPRKYLTTDPTVQDISSHNGISHQLISEDTHTLVSFQNGALSAEVTNTFRVKRPIVTDIVIK